MMMHYVLIRADLNEALYVLAAVPLRPEEVAMWHSDLWKSWTS